MTKNEQLLREVYEAWLKTQVFRPDYATWLSFQAGAALAQPAEHGTDWERVARVQDAKLRAMCNEPGGFEKLKEVMDRYKGSKSAEGGEVVCECHRCIKENDLRSGGLPLNLTKMILCPICGNKRCPHASDHRLGCTGSNEAGQPGSVYTPPASQEQVVCKANPQQPIAASESDMKVYQGIADNYFKAQQPATGEPVGYLYDFKYDDEIARDWFTQNIDEIQFRPATCLNIRPLYAHPSPSVPDDVVRDAERYRWLRDNQLLAKTQYMPTSPRGYLDAAIDAAMLAASS